MRLKNMTPHEIVIRTPLRELRLPSEGTARVVALPSERLAPLGVSGGPCLSCISGPGYGCPECNDSQTVEVEVEVYGSPSVGLVDGLPAPEAG